MKTTTFHSNLTNEYGIIVEGWHYVSWLSKDTPSDYEAQIKKSLKSDHGELRKVEERDDGKGLNCWCKEKS